jgi:hypothetical protein
VRQGVRDLNKMKAAKLLFKKYPVFRARSAPDLDVFSDSDVEALQYSLDGYGAKSAWTLSEESHSDRRCPHRVVDGLHVRRSELHDESVCLSAHDRFPRKT